MASEQNKVIAGALSAVVGGLSSATYSTARERILVCRHVGTSRGWRGFTDTIELPEDLAAAFAANGQKGEWSGKIKLCKACSVAAKNFLNSVGGRELVDSPS